MNQRTAILLAIVLDLILWLAIVTSFCFLWGCGGGGEDSPEDETRTTTIPVDCNTHPEICT